MRRLPQLFLFCASFLLAASAHADITFGQIVPLTSRDDGAGRQMADGARLYIDKVNAAGGVAGQKIAYIVRDNRNQKDETLVQAAQLIRNDHVYGLLPGIDTAQMRELVTSGLLQQKRVPLLALRRAGAESLCDDAAGISRETGLIEVAPPADPYAPLLNEYREALARHAPGATYSSAGLQGYIAAKVMVGAVRLLGPKPTHEEYFAVTRNMISDVSDRLVITGNTGANTRPE